MRQKTATLTHVRLTVALVLSSAYSGSAVADAPAHQFRVVKQVRSVSRASATPQEWRLLARQLRAEGARLARSSQTPQRDADYGPYYRKVTLGRTVVTERSRLHLFSIDNENRHYLLAVSPVDASKLHEQGKLIALVGPGFEPADALLGQHWATWGTYSESWFHVDRKQADALAAALKISRRDRPDMGARVKSTFSIKKRGGKRVLRVVLEHIGPAGKIDVLHTVAADGTGQLDAEVYRNKPAPELIMPEPPEYQYGHAGYSRMFLREPGATASYTLDITKQTRKKGRYVIRAWLRLGLEFERNTRTYLETRHLEWEGWRTADLTLVRR